MLRELVDCWNTFWSSLTTAYHSGNNDSYTSINDFINSKDKGPQWTEEEIMKWLNSRPLNEQNEIKQLTKGAQTRGIDPHEFLCELRREQEQTSREARQASIAHALNAWPQFQAEWLLTSAFCKDAFGGGLFNNKE